MRYLSIGTVFQNSAFEAVPLNVDVPLADGNLAVLCLPEIQRSYTGSGEQTLSTQQEQSVLEIAGRLKSELDYALSIGRIVIIQPAREMEWIINDPQGLRKIPDPFMQTLLPGMSVKTSEGEFIERLDDFPGPAIWEHWKNFLRYDVVLKNYPGKPIIRIKDTDQIVGSIKPIGRGLLILLPRFNSRQAQATEPSSRDQKIVDGMINLIENFVPAKTSDGFVPPKWMSTYLSKIEEKSTGALRQAEKDLNDAQEAVETARAEHEVILREKILFVGKGQILEDVVKEALSELGFELVDGRDSDADGVFLIEGRNLALEAKGTKGSASLKHVRQLVQWCAEEAGDDAEEPKGLLVINAFCELPLVGRTESIFPPNVTSYAKSRELCLLTGLQLFTLLQHLRNGEMTAATIQDKIFTTKGPLRGFDKIANIFIE